MNSDEIWVHEKEILTNEIFVPVGHIWKFDLERSKKKTFNFGVKFNFSKFRMEPVMHDFLAITENQKKRSQNNRVTIAGKLLEKSVGNCYSQFQ